jgi:uncharacterized protein DUF1376
MVAWFMHDIPAWMDGTEKLPDGQYRVYHVVCQLIYLNDGPITNNEHGIAGRCNQHILTYRANLKKLIDAGKLIEIDGRLSNARAVIELERVHERRLNSAKGGRASAGRPKGNHRATSDQPPGNLGATSPEPGVGSREVDPRLVGGRVEVGQRSVDGPPDNALKDNGSASSALSEQQHHKSRVEESREEKSNAAPNGARGDLFVTPSAPDPEADLFRRGKEVLGNSAGSLIARLLKARDGKVPLARAIIEQASLKQNPREYVGAVIRGQERNTSSGAIL